MTNNEHALVDVLAGLHHKRQMEAQFTQGELEAIQECLEAILPMVEVGHVGLNTETATVKALLAKVAALL